MRAAIAAILGRLPGLSRLKVERRSKRVLVHEILSIQIFSAALVGALAIATLYWGGQWVLQDNYDRWALQWTEELNELGSPLYLNEDSDARVRLESYVERYSEIDRVVYYATNGSALFSVDNDAAAPPAAGLSDTLLRDATAVVGSRQPYLLSHADLDPRQFEILAPVWTESIVDDGLFGFDPSNAEPEAKTELVGFISIKLDFIIFHDRLLANIKTAVMILLTLLFAFALFGHRALRNALKSFSQLEQPIRELAKGNLEVEFKPAEHREISDIVEALETTATALSERDAELLELANHDSLTGLFNRRRFMEELQNAVTELAQNGQSAALFFIDLDQFKYVNDACGHPAGDRLIRKVADELVRSVDEDAIVARFGGDEFAVLFPNADRELARSNAELVVANMRSMAHIEDDQVFHPHCSIGVTMMRGAHLNHDELIAQADIACREAKLAGRNRFHFFNDAESFENEMLADVGWMNRLRTAIDEDKFELLFQPINRIDTGDTTHHEVLIRVQSEDGKLVSPEAFLPSAVRFGLMSEIDLWVIRHAARAYAQHSENQPQLKLSINLSANAFENEDLHVFVKEAFAENDVPGEHIILEITESLAIRRPIHVERQVAELRKLGCEIALDDFGTGYSSFSYLQRLHFDYIKIDGAFVQDLLKNPVDQKMIKLIAEVGHEAGMQIIAEYVQDAESLALLGKLGVDMAQGFFVGRPSTVPRFASTPISLDSRRKRQAFKSP
ncbi:MAG: EAL domain-containing protein [Gammaproteobacteria bacterium]|nr:EAL domain-containing protein [Gammaproteobacteria bacterium]